MDSSLQCRPFFSMFGHYLARVWHKISLNLQTQYIYSSLLIFANGPISSNLKLFDQKIVLIITSNHSTGDHRKNNPQPDVVVVCNSNDTMWYFVGNGESGRICASGAGLDRPHPHCWTDALVVSGDPGVRDAHHFSGDAQADSTLQGPRPLTSDRRLALGHPGKPNVGRGQSPLYDIRFRKISTSGGAHKRNKQPKVKSLP